MVKELIFIILVAGMLFSCTNTGNKQGASAEKLPDVDTAVIASLKAMASTNGFKRYGNNPVLTVGPEGAWDAGALGSMTILKVGNVFHMYYEAWGKRSDKEWDAAEYETLAIGHATSKDGILWEKDPNNPVVPQGKKDEWDATGVWDPYVIYEDGLYKMWYGGGGGRFPNYGWAYAVSKDGSSFEKKGLIGKNNCSGVEDVHVVKDKDSGLYYLYYWHGNDDGEHLYCVTSQTETGFDFNESVIVSIEGDDSFWKKFGHVLKNDEGWHIFYSNYIPPHGRESIVRYATSEDGLHWQAKNSRLIYGLDADVLQVTDELYLMMYAPKNYFDKKEADIRVAIYNGTLTELASKPSFIETNEVAAIAGKEFNITLKEGGPHKFYFGQECEVIITELDDEENYAFNAYYEQSGNDILIEGEGFHAKGTFQNNEFSIK
jgi:predicted GH43/DUF377 family glycosyl hydrolase